MINDETPALLGRSLYMPTTFSVGFLECKPDVFVDAYVNWRSRHGYNPRVRQVDSIESGIRTLDPLSTPPDRFLIAGTLSRWSAYLDNGVNGSDPFSPIGHLAQVIQCQGVLLTCSPHIVIGGKVTSYYAVKFEIYGPQKTEWLNLVRGICVYNDGGPWKFYEKGKQMEFEDPSQYDKFNLMERFTPETMNTYCNSLGIYPFKPEFYGPKCWVIDITAPADRVTARKSMTRAEARQRFGLDAAP